MRRSHGMSGTPIYRRWVSMKHRTTPGTSGQKHNPGYVGVGRDPKWDTFEGFYEDMGATFFDGAVLARIGDSGDYEPGNVRWLTKTENARELMEGRGEMHLMSDGRFAVDVAREHGVDRWNLTNRIRRGWPVDRAATEPMIDREDIDHE